MKVQFDQVATLVIFLTCAVLLFLGIDGEVKTTMTLCVGYFVGSGIKTKIAKKGG